MDNPYLIVKTITHLRIIRETDIKMLNNKNFEVEYFSVYYGDTLIQYLENGRRCISTLFYNETTQKRGILKI